MTIRINHTPVDFTLEQETTVSDLTASLLGWAAEQNLALVGVLADGRAAGPETLLSSIQEIDVEAVPAGERDIARASVIAQYFELLEQGLSDNDQKLISELQLEYTAVREALFPLFEPLSDRIGAHLEILDRAWSDSSLAPAAAGLARASLARLKELQDPRHALNETFGELDSVLEHLPDLGVLFQKGLDKDAFDQILRLFTLVEDSTRRVENYLASGRRDIASWTAFQSELQPFLKETEGALATGDYILLTDLLEYEVSPRLTEMKGLFPEVSNLDPVKDLL